MKLKFAFILLGSVLATAVALAAEDGTRSRNVGTEGQALSGNLGTDAQALSRNLGTEGQAIMTDESLINKAAYRVGPGDVLQISAGPGAVRQEAIQRAEPIGPDGRISFDLIGSVYVEGMTTDQIDAELTRLLTEYIIDVEVTVIIATYEAKRVFVLGEVNRPGKYLINQNMTIMDAITEAGTTTRKASLKKVKLIKNASTADNQQVLVIDYKKMIKEGELDRNLALSDGDVIVVNPDLLSKWGYFVEKLFDPLRPVFYIGVITGLLRYAF